MLLAERFSRPNSLHVGIGVWGFSAHLASQGGTAAMGATGSDDWVTADGGNFTASKKEERRGKI